MSINLTFSVVEDLQYSPPMDIHWVWHVHMLAPVQYNKDCTATVDRILGHQPRSFKDLVDPKLKTCKLWEEHYPGVPFDIDLSTLESHPEELGKDESSVKYNVVAAALR